MRTFKNIRDKRSSIECNNSYEGERIEIKVERIVNNNEPISDGAPIIYTERKDGVNPAYDPRADRWEIALEATDVISKTMRGKRENKALEITGGKEANNATGTDGKAEPTQGTE